MEITIINEDENKFEITLEKEELEILVSYAINGILREKIKQMEEGVNGE